MPEGTELNTPVQETPGVADATVVATPSEGGEAPDSTQETADSEADKSEGAPEAYGEFKFPEGMQVIEADLKDFSEFAKTKNWSQETAQQVLDLSNKIEARRSEELAKTYEKIITDWADAAKNDKEFGGTKYDESIANAKKVIAKFNPSPAFQAFISDTGVGNHPEFIRLLAGIGAKMGEDTTVVTGANTAAPKVPLQESLYTSMKNLS